MSNKLSLVNHIYSYDSPSKGRAKINRGDVVKIVNVQGHTSIFGHDRRPLYIGLARLTGRVKYHAALEVIGNRYGVRGVAWLKYGVVRSPKKDSPREGLGSYVSIGT
jgi:hypothetical protein